MSILNVHPNFLDNYGDFVHRFLHCVTFSLPQEKEQAKFDDSHTVRLVLEASNKLSGNFMMT
jgi:hypothetical protein